MNTTLPQVKSVANDYPGLPLRLGSTGDCLEPCSLHLYILLIKYYLKL